MAQNFAKRKFKKRTEWSTSEIENGMGDSRSEALPKFYETNELLKDEFTEVWNSKLLPYNLKFSFVSSSKQKQFIKVKKVAEDYKVLLNSDIMVSFNESLAVGMPDMTKNILIEQEIDKITINMETGNVKMVKPDLNTFSGLIVKHGLEQVARANKLEDLIVENLTLN